jgi:hypothetical protein
MRTYHLREAMHPWCTCIVEHLTKRIFPSLYNMFVGGASCWGKGARMTVAQEVAEELGLKHAIDFAFGKGGGGG